MKTNTHRSAVLAGFVATLLLCSCANTTVGIRSALDVPVAGGTGRGALVTSDFSVGSTHGLTLETDISASARARIEASVRFASFRSDIATIQGNSNSPRPMDGFVNSSYTFVDVPVLVMHHVRVNESLTPYFGFGGMLSLGRSISWTSERTFWTRNENNEKYQITEPDQHEQSPFEGGISAVFLVGAALRISSGIDAVFDIRLNQLISDPSVKAHWAPIGVRELLMPTTTVVVGGGISVRL